jgi:hypothetical protein
VPLKTVLKSIGEQLDVRFVFSNKVINGDQMITLDVSKEKLATVLSNLLDKKSIQFDVIDDQIVLSKRIATQNPDAVNDEESIFGPAISGIVVDETNQPIVGVNVMEKGTTNGTVTDPDGKFSLILLNDNATLVFSFIGYTTKEIPVGSQTSFNVTLDPDIQTLGEVVVVGYGTVKKSDLTGSVSSVKSEQLTSFPASGVTQALQGRAAGVNIQANNGDPGENSRRYLNQCK